MNNLNTVDNLYTHSNFMYQLLMNHENKQIAKGEL